MSDHDDDGASPRPDYDRMSLDSLKRELEVQKARSATELEETRERLREGRESKMPWRMMAIAGVVTAVLAVGLLFVLKATLPRSTLIALDLPILSADDIDAGPMAEPEPAAAPEPAASPADAGAAAAPARRRGRRSPRRPPEAETPSPAPAPEPDPGGGFVDPIEGLTGD